MSGLHNSKIFHSLVSLKLFILMLIFSQTSPAKITDIKFKPYFSLRFNPNLVQFITDSIIVFISGCNVILYDFTTKSQKFLYRKVGHRYITSLSVGTYKSQKNKFETNLFNNIKYKTQTSFNFTRNDLKDIIICIGEYCHSENLFYVTTIRPFIQGKNGNDFDNENNTKDTFVIKSTENFWKINFCTILNNTNYCVVLSQKNSKTKNNNDVIYSRISFIKYPNEKFISQESIPE